MARSVRRNFLTDKVCGSTAPIGTILPVFISSNTNIGSGIADNGIIDGFASFSAQGTGYVDTGGVTGLTPYGVKLLPRTYIVNTTGSSASIATNGINTSDNTFYSASHGLASGDKLIVKTNTQGTICVVGGSFSLVFGQVFYAVYVDANKFKLAATRANAIAATPTTYSITTLGNSGTITFIGSLGSGALVEVDANTSGQLQAVSLKDGGYGYNLDDTLYVAQSGSGQNAKVRVATLITNSDLEDQYPGWLYCDGTSYNADSYPLLFKLIGTKYGGTASTAQAISSFGSMTGTFKVPDYKTRTLVGIGPVTGGSSPIYGNVIAAVGNSGGRWYFSKTTQESKFTIGNVVITGYSSITAQCAAILSGEKKVKIAPLQEKLLTGVPEHSHDVLCSSADQVGSFQGSTAMQDSYAASFKTSEAGVQYFFPPNQAAISHSHGIADYAVTDPGASTYGSVEGVGSKIELTVSSISSNQVTFSGNHNLQTGNRIVCKTNTQTTKATTQQTGSTALDILTDSVYYVTKISDTVVKLAYRQDKAQASNNLTLTAGSGGTITFYTGFSGAGNLPQTPTTSITTPSPLVYDFDNTSVIGGKAIVTTDDPVLTFPGTDVYNTLGSATYSGTGTFNLSGPTSSTSVIEVKLYGAYGTGASSNSGGTTGGYAQWTIGGNTYQAGGGGGGNAPTSLKASTGGTGGTAGAWTVPGGSAAAITGPSGTTISSVKLTTGNGGGTGGGYTGTTQPVGGTGGTDAVGITGAGTDGSSTYTSNKISFSKSFTTATSSSSPSTYSIPGSGYPLTSLTLEIIGGGGGHGGGYGSGGGQGGSGKKVTVSPTNISAGSNLVIYVGGPGGSGSGTSGGGVSQTGFARGGAGGNGNGGLGGGAGGSASAVGTESPAYTIAGAGGGGGGGGKGDSVQNSTQDGQPNPNNDTAYGLSALFAGDGAGGANASCNSAGGGGGGGGVGTSSGGVGLGGGSAGSNTHNGDGYGGKRGESSFDTDFISSANSAEGNNPAAAGSVTITGQYDASYYAAAGGGGASGSAVTFRMTGTTSGSTLVVQSGASARIRYGVVSSGTSTSTSVTSGLIDSSTDGVDYVTSGAGTGGASGGFTSPDGYKYLRWSGTPTGGVRTATTISLNAENMVSMTVRAIVGNNSNGGEIPEEPISVYYSIDNKVSWNLAGQLIPAYTDASGVNGDGANVWKDYTLTFANAMKYAFLYLQFRQNHSGGDSTSTNDNVGFEKVTFTYGEVSSTTYTTATGRWPMNIEYIEEYIQAKGTNVFNSTGIEVNDGVFTMSSSVPVSITPDLVPQIDIPLVTRYHRVKYMIRAY